MSETTLIGWCDSTFNPWEGCTPVGRGCDHCYAEHRNARFGGGIAPNWGPGAPRRRTSATYWKQPLRWNAQPFYECTVCGWRGFTKYGTAVCCDVPAKLVRRRVFCASLADVFDNEVDPQWRADLFELIAATPNLDWLLLTKRIGNARQMMEIACTAVRLMGAEWPLPNVWMGATVCTQDELDRDIGKLLAITAAVRYLSVEPMLGTMDLRLAFTGHCPTHDFPGGFCVQRHHAGVQHLDWVICGGESGPKARPMHPDWPRSLRDQCVAAGVPFFFKQWGEWAPLHNEDREAGIEEAWVGAERLSC